MGPTRTSPRIFCDPIYHPFNRATSNGPQIHVRWPPCPAHSVFAISALQARRMCLARDGNVAIIFALALLPIFAFIGAAIDYSRVNMARSAMQSALD